MASSTTKTQGHGGTPALGNYGANAAQCTTVQTWGGEDIPKIHLCGENTGLGCERSAYPDGGALPVTVAFQKQSDDISAANTTTYCAMQLKLSPGTVVAETFNKSCAEELKNRLVRVVVSTPCWFGSSMGGDYSSDAFRAVSVNCNGPWHGFGVDIDADYFLYGEGAGTHVRAVGNLHSVDCRDRAGTELRSWAYSGKVKLNSASPRRASARLARAVSASLLAGMLMLFWLPRLEFE
jgi:hypothetical protein